MISIFFNESGYYITGEGVENTLRCSSSYTKDGELTTASQHLYKVLWSALQEIRHRKIEGEIIVYNDSRVIDEMNGLIPIMDSDCKQWRIAIRQDVLSEIKTVVFFRKKSQSFVQNNLQKGQNSLLRDLQCHDVESLIKHMKDDSRNRFNNRKKFILNKFRNQWFGGSHGTFNR